MDRPTAAAESQSMTDQTMPPLSPDPATTPESSNQLIVALAIVAGLVLLGVAMIGAALINSTVGAALGIGTAVGTIIGGLLNALNAPSGIGKVLNAAKQVPQPQQNGTNT